MNCLSANEAIDFADGRGGADDRLAVEAHVASCETCRQMIAAMLRDSSADHGGAVVGVGGGSPVGGVGHGGAVGVGLDVGDSPAVGLGGHGGAVGEASVPGSVEIREFEPGTRIDRFEILELLGQGGMGRVYRARDLERGSELAIKTLRQVDAEILLRFKNEFRALQDLHHENLVSLGEFIETDGQWILTMEFIDGVDVLRYVRGDGLDLHKLRAALIQIAVGLGALHAAGKVHRDIKPSNILVTPAGRVVILDFGLIGEAVDVRNAGSDPVGTVAYMAPEQAAARGLGSEADWYSVGVLLYQALTGVLPFVGASMQVLLDKQEHVPAAPSTRVADLPQDLEQLCVDLLQIDPASRPRGSQVLARLGASASDLANAGSDASHQSSTARRSTAFVGRQTELAVLRDGFERTRKGTPVVIHIHGESGVGKSALIRHFSSQLRSTADDAVVLAGRCYQRETVPYKALDGVIDALSGYMRRLSRDRAAVLVPRNAALLPRVFPVLGRVEMIAQAPAPRYEIRDAQELRLRVFAALRELLCLIAERAPLVCVIDDLQWADPDSLFALSELMRPSDAPPLLLLTSSRSNSSEERRELELLESGDERRIMLQPLLEPDARELARILLKKLDARADVSAESIVSEAQGHPLYIDELVRHTAIEEVGEHKRLRLDEAITVRAGRLGQRALHVLELVSIAATPLLHDTICQAAEMDHAEFAKQVAVLRVANLVRGRGQRGSETLEPYHGRVREAIVEHAEPAACIAHHGRLAIALESVRGGRPELLLHHLEAAGELGKAGRYAVQAAERATSTLAFERAAQLYRNALRLNRDTSEAEFLRELQISLATSLAIAGHGALAADEYLAAAVDADAATRRECRRRAAEQLLITGHIEGGLQTLDTLLADVGMRLPRTPTRALVSVAWQRLKLRLRGLDWKPRHEREIADSDLARLDVCLVAASGLAMVDNVRGADFQTRGLLMALGLGEQRRVCHAIGMEAIFNASQGKKRFAHATSLLEESKRIAADSQDPYLLAFSTGTEGVTGYLMGHYRRAADLLVQAEVGFLSQAQASTLERNNARLFHLFALRSMGAMGQWQGLVDEYVRDASRRGDLYAETSMRRTNNLVWLVRDQPDQARLDLESTSWAPPETGYHLQHLYGTLARVDHALYIDDLEGLEAEVRSSFAGLDRSLLLRIELVRTIANFIWGRFFLRLSRSSQDRDRALAQVAVSIKKLGRDGGCQATAYRLLLQAGLACRQQRPQDARADLLEAAQVSQQYDMSLVGAIAQRRRGELVGGDEGQALVALADAWMADESIANPARIAATYTPGFD